MKYLFSLFALLLTLLAAPAMAADACSTITPQNDFFAAATNNQVSLSGTSCLTNQNTVVTWNGTITYSNFAPARVPGFKVSGSTAFTLNANLATGAISVTLNGPMVVTYLGQTYNISFNNVSISLAVNTRTGAISATSATGTVTVNGQTIPVGTWVFDMLL